MARKTKKTMSVNALKAAARMADIDSLYRVVEQDPHVLKYIDSMQFVETPLHVVAASSVDLPRRIQFATEIMTLKPSFALKLNPQGLTPIHLALQNGHNRMALQNGHNINRMALRLVDINKDLVRAKMRGGLTPLHLASQSGDIDLLTEFLKACPDSIEDVTVTGETALHLAIKNNFEAFKFLVKWLTKETPQLDSTILNRKDNDGNTILDIAALNNAGEAIKLLIKVTDFSTGVFAENLMGQTALNLAAGSEYIQRILERQKGIVTMRRNFFSSIVFMARWLFPQFSYRGRMTEENRNAYLVVATLVATATYQAALSPPGGLHQTDVIGTNDTLVATASNLSITEGTSIMSNPTFCVYSTTNMCAFLASTFTIIGLLPRHVAWFPLYISTLLLISSYFLSMIVISPNDFTGAFFWVTFLFLSYIFSMAMLSMMTSINYV